MRMYPIRSLRKGYRAQVKSFFSVLSSVAGSPSHHVCTLLAFMFALSLFSSSAYSLGAQETSQKAVKAHSKITEYTGPETCIACHEQEALQAHDSVHYQQTGMTPNVTNISGTAGKHEDAFNTYCGSIRTSPIFTCAGCHVGNGLPPTAVASTEQLNNVDCLMCHQDKYLRVGAPPYEDVEVIGADSLPTTISVPIEESFRYMPDTDKMEISILEAARTVHPTTRESCLRCHARASGSDGGKRGDMSTAMINPPRSSDIHMSPQGENITCADCHDAGDHKVLGRGLDLRPNDHPDTLTCGKCHSDTPHGDKNKKSEITMLDQHATRVACQTCHIPTFAKDISTEMVRDWTVAHYLATSCGGLGGWVPGETRESNVIPSYRWYDNTSQVYVLGQVPTENADGEKALGVPNGGIDSTGSKIYPMKEHRSVAAQLDASGLMIPHATFDFFATGDFDLAVEVGMEKEGMEGSYTLTDVHTFQTINHGVEDSDNALQCGACHASFNNGRDVRMDLQGELGYELKTSTASLCTECHENKRSPGFIAVHKKHVDGENIECSSCHNFSRPERQLTQSLTLFQTTQAKEEQ